MSYTKYTYKKMYKKRHSIMTTGNNSLYRVVQKKTAQSLMHCYFATLCSKITRFSPKCSEKIMSISQCKICISWLNIL